MPHSLKQPPAPGCSALFDHLTGDDIQRLGLYYLSWHSKMSSRFGILSVDHGQSIDRYGMKVENMLDQQISCLKRWWEFR